MPTIDNKLLSPSSELINHYVVASGVPVGGQQGHLPPPPVKFFDVIMQIHCPA